MSAPEPPQLALQTTMGEAIEIRHLRYFLAVAETENFTRAAKRLGITQPSISQGIAQLEQILRTALFRRIGKRVQLSEAGTAFRKGAEVVLRKLEDARAAVLDIAGVITGHVDIGVIPPLHVGWMPPVLDRMARDYPGVTVSVQERASSIIETELEAGRLDLGLGIVSRSSRNSRYERLVSSPFSLLVSEGHEFKERKTINPRGLEGIRLLMLPGSFDMRRVADEILRRARVHVRVVFEIDNIDSILSSVVRTGIPTLLPAIVLHGRNVLRLRAIPIVGKDIHPIEFGVLWPSTGSASPAALMLAKSLKMTFVSARPRQIRKPRLRRRRNRST